MSKLATLLTNNYTMKKALLSIVFLSSMLAAYGQPIIIDEGAGVGPLKLGQTMKEAVNILGFKGEPKTYNDYLAEELFNEDPEKSLECELGFDYYIKYAYLLTLPVSYVFFKNDVITQIKVSSFPAYYFSIAKDTRTQAGINFWSPEQAVVSTYGNPDLKVNYEDFILDTYFYFDEGIAINFRDDHFRSAHIFKKPNQASVEEFKKVF